MRAAAPIPAALPAVLAVLAVLAALPPPAAADTVIAARTMRAGSVIGPLDLAIEAGVTPGALADPAAAIGQEARVILYAGRPVHAADLGPPAVIGRNEIVTLVYRAGGLSIVTEGRALGRAGVGDRIDVMNLGSRSTVAGTVTGPGAVRVGPPGPGL
jgi:flagellar basal body P-ring formation protein FlgA